MTGPAVRSIFWLRSASAHFARAGSAVGPCRRQRLVHCDVEQRRLDTEGLGHHVELRMNGPIPRWVAASSSVMPYGRREVATLLAPNGGSAPTGPLVRVRDPHEGFQPPDVRRPPSPSRTGPFLGTFGPTGSDHRRLYSSRTPRTMDKDRSQVTQRVGASGRRARGRRERIAGQVAPSVATRRWVG